MQRYDCDPDGKNEIYEQDEGEYVLHSEARAEIERLEKEVERLQAEVMEARESLRLAVKSADLADAAIETAWNDAIEAAVEVADNQPIANSIRYKIRALKRPTP